MDMVFQNLLSFDTDLLGEAIWCVVMNCARSFFVSFVAIEITDDVDAGASTLDAPPASGG